MTRPRSRKAPWLQRLIGASAFAACIGTLAPDAGAGPPRLTPDHIAFRQAMARWDVPGAREAVAEFDGVERVVLEAAVDINEAEYARAQARLAPLVATGVIEDDDLRAEALEKLALARAALLVFEGQTPIVSPDGHFEVVFADPADAIIAPYFFDAMSRAREVLGDEIGVRPEERVRFEFIDDPAKLAVLTPLTLENVYTTSTVGITKYRRVMMVSPRVMLHGYGWIDTAVHEYVHYLVTQRTGDNTPVWMHEGLAKVYEARWRVSVPPPIESARAQLLHDALVTDSLITFDEMSPSFAMLPTREESALAYTQVETMLAYLAEVRGPQALRQVLAEVAGGMDAEMAIGHAWGSRFAEFEKAWKKEMLKRTRGEEGTLAERRFRDPEATDEDDPSLLGDVFSHLGGGRARQHARLGVLLTLRGHHEAAMLEYERARKADARAAKDPKLARRLGELYLALDRPADALPLLELAAQAEPENATLAAAEGRARLRTGDPAGAKAALDRALRNNPFIPTIHCDLAELATDPARATFEREQCRD